jgi:hypothetical protein
MLELNEAAMIRQVYGWSPFNTNCLSTTYNQLYDTPLFVDRYQAIKKGFDDLQYDGLKPAPGLGMGQFDPYVALIHGADYIDAPLVYAYSVDDGVGNMQAKGTGLVIAVGGPLGLPNPHPASQPVNINFGPFTVLGPSRRIDMTKYAICSPSLGANVYDVVATHASFVIGADDPPGCPVSFRDSDGVLYTFKLKTKPPYPPPPPANLPIPQANRDPIDCTGNADGKAMTWCASVFAYTDNMAGPARSETKHNANAPGPTP